MIVFIYPEIDKTKKELDTNNIKYTTTDFHEYTIFKIPLSQLNFCGKDQKRITFNFKTETLDKDVLGSVGNFIIYYVREYPIWWYLLPKIIFNKLKKYGKLYMNIKLLRREQQNETGQ